MTKQAKQTLSWFGAGFAIAAILTASLDVIRFVPVAVAFGFLCFGCGVLLMQFLSLRRETGDWMTKTYEAMVKLDKLIEDEAKVNAEKSKLEEEIAEWKANKEVAVFDEIIRMSKEEPDRLLAFHKQLLRIAEKEAADRGGRQIDRDMTPNAGEPNEEEQN